VRGDAPVIGETNASWTSVKHGFSVDNGPSRDTSLVCFVCVCVSIFLFLEPTSYVIVPLLSLSSFTLVHCFPLSLSSLLFASLSLAA
jgi:hypothetical protein